jgi:hypothetical protein
MTARLLALGLAVLAVIGCGLDSDGDQRESKGYRSPHGVCDSFFAALERRDFKQAVACLDPASVTELAGEFAWSGLCKRDEIDRKWARSWHRRPDDEDRHLSDEERRERRLARDQLSLVLDRHGLTARVVRKLQTHATKRSAEDSVASFIADQAGFVTDYLEVTHKADPRWRADGAPRPRLVEVAILPDGRSASGLVLYPYEFKDKGERRDNKQPVKFVALTAGDWRIVHSPGLHFVP